MAGYSKRSLVDKLGIKSNFKVCLVNPPDDYQKTLGKLPDGVQIVDEPSRGLDFIHLFARNRSELTTHFAKLKQSLAMNGMLWVSWPKKASNVPTDLTGDIVRGIGLEHGLVDVKVCAVDEVWSGLKFVYRLEDRK